MPSDLNLHVYLHTDCGLIERSSGIITTVVRFKDRSRDTERTNGQNSGWTLTKARRQNNVQLHTVKIKSGGRARSFASEQQPQLSGWTKGDKKSQMPNAVSPYRGPQQNIELLTSSPIHPEAFWHIPCLPVFTALHNSECTGLIIRLEQKFGWLQIMSCR